MSAADATSAPPRPSAARNRRSAVRTTAATPTRTGSSVVPARSVNRRTHGVSHGSRSPAASRATSASQATTQVCVATSHQIASTPTEAATAVPPAAQAPLLVARGAAGGADGPDTARAVTLSPAQRPGTPPACRPDARQELGTTAPATGGSTCAPARPWRPPGARRGPPPPAAAAPPPTTRPRGSPAGGRRPPPPPRPARWRPEKGAPARPPHPPPPAPPPRQPPPP